RLLAEGGDPGLEGLQRDRGVGIVGGQDHDRVDLVLRQQLVDAVDDRDVLAERLAGIGLPVLTRIGHDRDRRALPRLVGMHGQGVARTEADDADSEVVHVDGTAFEWGSDQHRSMSLLRDPDPTTRSGEPIYKPRESFYDLEHPVKQRRLWRSTLPWSGLTERTQLVTTRSPVQPVAPPGEPAQAAALPPNADGPESADRPTAARTGSTSVRSGPRRPKKSLSARLRRDWQMLVLMIPGALALLFFFYIPILGNVIAFQDYQPYLEITEAPFVGFSKFTELFQDDRFVLALRNTLVYAAFQLVLFFPLPILLALKIGRASCREG